MDIVDALEARRGTTCVVGAGGKKTTMATLAARLNRAVVTATVRIPLFSEWVADVVVTEDPVAAIERAGADDWPLGLVPEQERPDRYYGYDRAVVDRIGETGHPTLVKADGARMRRFKAPAEHEPQLPATTDVVVPIASVHVVGEPLTDERVHRVDRVAEITGRAPGDDIRPVDVARVLASDAGGLKDVPEGATPIPLLNMVDDETLAETAREVAAELHDLADVPRVVLAELRADDPLVGVV